MAQNLTPEDTKEKLTRALRAKAVLTERSRRLIQQLEDFRNREHSQDHVTSELLERQRELNYMLHRASSVLHQLQDTNLALSAEFTHIVKELPAPKEKESNWDETISRVEDLFQKTHELAGEMQDEIFRTTSEPVIPKMRTEDPRTQAPEQVAVVEVQSPPIEEDHRPPADAHEAEFRPSDEPHASPSPKRRAKTAVPKAEPPKEESPDHIFSRLDAYEAEKSPAARNGDRRPSLFDRIMAWLNRES